MGPEAVLDTCNSNNLEVDGRGGLNIQTQPGLHSKSLNQQ